MSHAKSAVNLGASAGASLNPMHRTDAAAIFLTQGFHLRAMKRVKFAESRFKSMNKSEIAEKAAREIVHSLPWNSEQRERLSKDFAAIIERAIAESRSEKPMNITAAEFYEQNATNVVNVPRPGHSEDKSGWDGVRRASQAKFIAQDALVMTLPDAFDFAAKFGERAIAESRAPQPEYKCPECGEKFDHPVSLAFDGKCADCWPGYNLCKACNDYRCEHIAPTAEDLADPEFRSCHCGNDECRAGFVEGSTNRIVNRKEFAAIRESWKSAELGDGEPSPPPQDWAENWAKDFHDTGNSKPRSRRARK